VSQNIAERTQKIRDLRGQIGGLAADDEQEIVFQEISPRRRKVTIYSMVNGQPVEIPAYMVAGVLEKRLDDGGYMFTAYKEQAPEFQPGTVKCFLHPESPDRPILEEIGLSGVTCPAAHLANMHSRRVHARHRHKEEWAAYCEHVDDQKELERNRHQQAQLDATLEIARAASGQASPVEAPSAAQEEANPVCNSCGDAIEGALADHQCNS